MIEAFKNTEKVEEKQEESPSNINIPKEDPYEMGSDDSSQDGDDRFQEYLEREDKERKIKRHI